MSTVVSCCRMAWSRTDMMQLCAQVSLAKAVEELAPEEVCVGMGVWVCGCVRRCVQFLHRHVLRVGFSCLR